MDGLGGRPRAPAADQPSGLVVPTVIVLMTGWDPGRTHSDHDAVDLRLAKPFEREDVERVLQEAVALRQQWRELHAAGSSVSS